MKIFTRTLAAVALVTATGGAMANDIEGNVTLASDYVYRGVSQTDNGAAIQGGFDYTHALEPVSWYVGAWGSNIDSDFFPQDPVMELDIYTGLTGEVGEFGYDVGWLRYFYPSGSINNTSEWHAGGSWKWFGATVYYSKDWFGTDDSAGRLEGTFDYDLPYEIGLSASVANNYGDGVEAFFDDSYVDWTIGVSKSWMGVDWAATYTDTDISSSDCGDPDLCDSTFVVSMSKSF
ncbi:MAG: hypothetical protein JSU75_04945 [Gammaproteobacteria bacterium]|nr:MAG: hypothetical protein JSU75_04945 [Gammaproteobacteria bacterium]